MTETLVEKQVRLMQEKRCREIVDVVKPQLPAGTGFTLFIFDYGDPGKFQNLSYVSTADREDMIKTVEEWLERQGTTVTPVANRLIARTLRTVADSLEGIVIQLRNPKVDAAKSVVNIVKRLRGEAEKLEPKGGTW